MFILQMNNIIAFAVLTQSAVKKQKNSCYCVNHRPPGKLFQRLLTGKHPKICDGETSAAKMPIHVHLSGIITAPLYYHCCS